MSRVLLVDDDAATLDALSSLITARLPDIVVDTCDSGAVALERIRETDYDSIISDIKMPMMDGLALMQRVLDLRPSTPTLLITGHGDHDLGVRALNAGAYAFISKPIDREYFTAWLQRAIQLRQLSRQVETQNRTLEQHVRDRTTALKESEMRLRHALDGARIGMWWADLAAATLECTPLNLELFGLDANARMPTTEEWLALVHPEDREAMVATWSKGLTDKTPYEFDYRIVRPDGAIRWLASRARFESDDEGGPVTVMGITMDVTERKLAEDEARRLAAIVEATSDFVGIAGLDGEILYLNRAGRRLLGIPEDAPPSSFRHAALCPGWVYERTEREWLPIALAEGSVSGEGALLTLDGREIPVSFVLIVHRTASGAPQCISTIARHLTEGSPHDVLHGHSTPVNTCRLFPR